MVKKPTKDNKKMDLKETIIVNCSLVCFHANLQKNVRNAFDFGAILYNNKDYSEKSGVSVESQ
jgi:hypothetical protein